MRQETNNEMDLLLRRLGRQQDAAMPDDHLDADELNSYAENVLPPTARARYTEHLAECARCRDLVVQLSSSAGVVVAQETAKVSEPSAWRKFLASLFSPMVLRYAVPALGLVVVAAIGFMVSRNEGNNSPVAEVHPPAQTSAPASQPQSSPSPGGDLSGFVDTTKSVAKPAVKGEADAASGGAAAPPPPNAPPVVSSVDAEINASVKKVEQQQAEAKEAAPAPKPTPSIEELNKQARAENRVVVANEPAAEKAKETETAKTQDRGRFADLSPASPGAAKRRAEARGVASVQSDGTTGSKREDDAADKDKNDAETRTVAGRRFRKQGGVWIDTDYSSARAVTSVARNSEQYRGLVADEPAIKQIADTLEGEIIVVWKNRTYRIR